MKTKFDRCQGGFSLAELMVVIVIIALLATVVVQNLMPTLFKSQAKIAGVEIASICSALDNFAVENGGKYPESLEVLVTPDEHGITYLKDQTSVPLDPWKNPYVYEPPRGGTGPYRVISYGKDGQQGGEADDADIDNFTIRERK